MAFNIKLSPSTRAKLTFGAIVFLNVIQWPISCSPDILRSLLMSTNTNAVISELGRSGIEASEDRYEELSWLLATSSGMVLAASSVVVLLAHEIPYGVMAALGAAFSAYSTFMFFNGESRMEILSAAVVGGLAAGLIGSGTTHVVRALPFDKWERGFVAIGLVPDLGLIIPIIFDIIMKFCGVGSVPEVVKKVAHNADAASKQLLEAAQQKLLNTERLVQTTATSWTVIVFLTGFIIYVLIPDERKIKKYKTFKHMDHGVENPKFDYWESCGEYMGKKDRIAHGMSISEYTYGYETESSEDGTEVAALQPYGTGDSPTNNLRIGTGSTGAAAMQHIANSLSRSSGDNPKIISYTGYQFHARDWRAQSRSIPFFTAILATIIGQVTRVFILIHLRTLFFEVVYVNQVLEFSGEVSKQYTLFGNVFAATTVDKFMMFFNYFMPACVFFSIVVSRLAYISLQFLLWSILGMWLFGLALMCVTNPLCNLIGAIICLFASSQNFSLYKNFAREFLALKMSLWPDILAGGVIPVFFYYQDYIWDYIGLEAVCLEKRTLIAEQFMTDESLASSVWSSPAKISELLPYHQYLRYISLFNIILIIVPLVRVVYDRAEFYKAIREKEEATEAV